MDYIKEVQRLRKRDYRRKTGLTIIEGLPELKRALQAHVKIQTLFWCKDILPDIVDLIKGLPVQEVSKAFFKDIAFGQRLKGVLAIAYSPQVSLKDLSLPKNSFFIILDGVEKPGNIGTIIRTGFGAGVNAVVLCDAKTDVYNHNIVRSSIGSVFHVPTLASSVSDIGDYLKEQHIPIYVATAKATAHYDACDFRQPVALVVGSEDKGVQDKWYDYADENILIPMCGDVGCLNVAASASILMYEVSRQRRQK